MADVMSTARRLARSQFHVVARRQLSVDARQIKSMVASGEWDWATRRVLRLVGGRRSFEQRCMIAVLHTGGWLCGETTLALCRVPGFGQSRIRVVIRRGAHCEQLPGVYVSQVRSLPHDHLVHINGIPSVTPTRAIYDLAARHNWDKVRRALKNTWRRRWTSGALVHQMGPEWLGRGRPGTVAMRELLAVTPNDWRMPDTQLEDRLASLLEEVGPRPKRQVNLGNDSRWIGRVDLKEHEIWHEPDLVKARWAAERMNCQRKTTQCRGIPLTVRS